MDRNAKSVLYGLYTSIGYGVGSILGGYLYDELGFSTLMQGAAILTVLWCILFALVQKCVRHKHKVSSSLCAIMHVKTVQSPGFNGTFGTPGLYCTMYKGIYTCTCNYFQNVEAR